MSRHSQCETTPATC